MIFLCFLIFISKLYIFLITCAHCLYLLLITVPVCSSANNYPSLFSTDLSVIFTTPWSSFAFLLFKSYCRSFFLILPISFFYVWLSNFSSWNKKILTLTLSSCWQAFEPQRTTLHTCFLIWKADIKRDLLVPHLYHITSVQSATNRQIIGRRNPNGVVLCFIAYVMLIMIIIIIFNHLFKNLYHAYWDPNLQSFKKSTSVYSLTHVAQLCSSDFVRVCGRCSEWVMVVQGTLLNCLKPAFAFSDQRGATLERNLWIDILYSSFSRSLWGKLSHLISSYLLDHLLSHEPPARLPLIYPWIFSVVSLLSSCLAASYSPSFSQYSSSAHVQAVTALPPELCL